MPLATCSKASQEFWIHHPTLSSSNFSKSGRISQFYTRFHVNIFTNHVKGFNLRIGFVFTLPNIFKSFMNRRWFILNLALLNISFMEINQKENTKGEWVFPWNMAIYHWQFIYLWKTPISNLSCFYWAISLPSQLCNIFVIWKHSIMKIL